MMQWKKYFENISKHRTLYMFLVLPMIWLLLFCYQPMLGVQIAFKKYTIEGGIWGSSWNGLTNFTRFFSSYMFKRVIKNTLILSFYSLIAGFPLPIIFALFLNTMRNLRLKKMVQMVTYAPHFISTTVLVGMIFTIFNPMIGLYGNIFRYITNSTPPDLFSNASAFKHIYVWSGIWQSLGWNAIIYIAALSSVDVELHEAAKIDGANQLQRVLYIDFPSILPTASILLILNAGNIMSVGFEKVYLMQNSLNLSASETISTYVYKIGLTGGMDFSYSTAVGLFNSVVNMAMLILVNSVTKRISKTSLF